MTVMRKELRDLLLWCLEQPGKFRCPDAMAHFKQGQGTIGKKMRALEAQDFLQREVVNQIIHNFTVINREKAELAAQTESIHKHQTLVRKPRIRHKKSSFARVNFIFSAAQQL